MGDEIAGEPHGTTTPGDGPRGRDRAAHLHQHRVVRDRVMVDGSTRTRLVVGDERVEGRRVGGPPEPVLHPGQVVHGVAEVGELPVDEPGEVAAGGDEVAGPGVTLDQHRALDRSREHGRAATRARTRSPDRPVRRRRGRGAVHRSSSASAWSAASTGRVKPSSDSVSTSTACNSASASMNSNSAVSRSSCGESREVGGARRPVRSAVPGRRRSPRGGEECGRGSRAAPRYTTLSRASDSTEPEKAPAPLSSRTTSGQWLTGTFGVDEPRDARAAAEVRSEIARPSRRSRARPTPRGRCAGPRDAASRTGLR